MSLVISAKRILDINMLADYGSAAACKDIHAVHDTGYLFAQASIRYARIFQRNLTAYLIQFIPCNHKINKSTPSFILQP